MMKIYLNIFSGFISPSQSFFFVSLNPINISQDSPVGTYIATFKAIDADLGTNSEIVYSIISGNTNNDLYLNMTNGGLTTANTLDYEKTASYQVSALTVKEIFLYGCMHFKVQTVNKNNSITVQFFV